ncbi:MAG: translation elongation factor Ts [Ignavibacteriae bacterium]|nr:translation elongation factor Ts [Ignavibacteriota bacterium]
MEITAEIVKKLRDQTGAGMMDCKKALAETNGNFEKAIEYLRKKGAATAEKRADRATKQGVVEAYIHAGGRIGTMVELNCESDFVAKTEEFKALAKDIAMQIAAMNPLYISREHVSKEIIEREMEIYRTQARNEKKPDAVVEKISEGRLEKYFQEFCLIEQSFIRESSKTIKDLILEMMGKTGEKISISRFQRYHLGETSQ